MGVGLAVSLLLLGCASFPPCDEVAVPDEVLIQTARQFLAEELHVEGSDSFEYSVSRGECGYVVVADMAPLAFDSDFMIFIDSSGVFRAWAPTRPAFDVEGDSLWNLPVSKPYPLATEKSGEDGLPGS